MRGQRAACSMLGIPRLCSRQPPVCFRRCISYKLRRAPSVIRRERGPAHFQKLRPDGARYQWPTGLLESAVRDKIIPITAHEARLFLDDLASLKARNDLQRSHVQNALQEHQLKPVHLTMLAHILLQVEAGQLQAMAKTLLISAADLREEFAVSTLMGQAVRFNRKQDLAKPELRVARAQLEQMARRENQGAKILQARVLEVEGADPHRALELLEKAMAQPPAEGNQTSGAALAMGWHAIARMRTRLGRQDEARQAVEIAALQHDDPKAYYMLATYTDPASSRYVEYMLKAAASGIGDAAYKMGLWNLNELEREKKLKGGRGPVASLLGRSRSPFAPTVDTGRWNQLVRQWFSVAMESLDSFYRHQAKMHLARLFFQDGDIRAARQLIQELADERLVPPFRIKWLRELEQDGGANQLTSVAFEAKISDRSS